MAENHPNLLEAQRFADINKQFQVFLFDKSSLTTPVPVGTATLQQVIDVINNDINDLDFADSHRVIKKRNIFDETSTELSLPLQIGAGQTQRLQLYETSISIDNGIDVRIPYKIAFDGLFSFDSNNDIEDGFVKLSLEFQYTFLNILLNADFDANDLTTMVGDVSTLEISGNNIVWKPTAREVYHKVEKSRNVIPFSDFNENRLLHTGDNGTQETIEDVDNTGHRELFNSMFDSVFKLDMFLLVSAFDDKGGAYSSSVEIGGVTHRDASVLVEQVHQSVIVKGSSTDTNDRLAVIDGRLSALETNVGTLETQMGNVHAVFDPTAMTLTIGNPDATSVVIHATSPQTPPTPPTPPTMIDFFYGTTTTDDVSMVDVSSLTDLSVTTGSGNDFTFVIAAADYSDGDNLVLFVPVAHDLQHLFNVASGFDEKGAFTRTADARTISGVSYNSYILLNLVGGIERRYRGVLQ